MATERFTVEVQPDFIERQAKARPIDALAEIIWNGLDADATTVNVRLGHGEFGLSSIAVTDNVSRHSARGSIDPFHAPRRVVEAARGGFTKTKTPHAAWLGTRPSFSVNKMADPPRSANRPTSVES
jgi:Histidine kinase-, DNA gyrase B-, and HSP90-like ATPase